MTTLTTSTIASMHTQGQPHERIHAENAADRQRLDRRQHESSSKDETSITTKMLAAVTGSILTSFLITPLDVVRVRLQTQASPSPPTARLPSFLHIPPNLGVSACCREVFWVQNHSQFCVAAPDAATLSTSAAVLDQSVVSDCAAEAAQKRTFNSTFDGLRKIARNEGIWTLWRGLSPTLLMAIPSNVIYFAGYDWLRTNPASPFYGRISDVTAPLVAGSVARVFSAAAIGPLEMLRTRMQAAQSSQKNVLRDTVRDMRVMVSEQGVTSMWRGLTLTLWRDVPFSALYWWGYEFIRKRLDESRARQSPSQSGEPLSHAALMMDSFLAGATAGAVSAFVTTPFDVGKTRQQTVMDKLTQEQRRNTPEGKSMPRFIWHIYTTEGTAGLFKGWTARCLKIAPGCAIMISSYEIGKKMAQKKVPDNE